MNSWAADTKVDELIAKSREVKPGRALLTAVAETRKAAKKAWPYVVVAASGLAEAIAVLFVAVGWILGFIFWYCPKGVFYGFCEGGKILPSAERAARRPAARKEDAGRAEVPGR